MEEIKQLEQMKQTLMNCIQPQIMGHLDQVDAKELGEAVDMLKDLSEAIYYCTITEAMKADKDNEHGKEQMRHYRDTMMYPTTYQRMYPMYDDPRMYYEGGRGGSRGNSGSNNSDGGNRGYSNPMSQMQDMEAMRDLREGRSGMRRKNYMEGKQMHRDKPRQMQELEAYMQELTSDLTEMIQDASPEEKQLLQQRISTLATKIK